MATHGNDCGHERTSERTNTNTSTYLSLAKRSTESFCFPRLPRPAPVSSIEVRTGVCLLPLCWEEPSSRRRQVSHCRLAHRVQCYIFLHMACRCHTAMRIVRRRVEMTLPRRAACHGPQQKDLFFFCETVRSVRATSRQ